jgi:hypothetical protein
MTTQQAYLFRAALSEMRAEMTTRTRAETAAMHAQSAAQRREVDALSAKLKEGIDGLKHEYVKGLSFFFLLPTQSGILQNPNGYRESQK